MGLAEVNLHELLELFNQGGAEAGDLLGIDSGQESLSLEPVVIAEVAQELNQEDRISSGKACASLLELFKLHG